MSEIERYDSSPLINVAVGVGTRRDPHEQTFVRSPLVFNREALDAYYRSSWACRRVVEIMPRLMCRKWGALTLGGEGNTDAIAHIEKRHGDLKVRANFKKAQTWANLYGRAYILMVVDDNEDYSQPLEKGAEIENLVVLDRWKMYPELGITGWDLLNPEYYTLASTQTSKLILPSTYTFGQKIHKSRVLIFSGHDLPDTEKQRNNGCEASVLESFVDVWKRFFVGYASLSRLLVDFDIFVHSIDGLFEKLWQGGREAENTLRSRIETNDLFRSVYRTVVMDKTKESGEFKSRNLGGAGDIADRLKSELVAASGLPQSVLFGEFAAGLDASGKITGEQRYLNDLTEEAQQDKFSDNAHILNEHLLNEPGSPTPDSFGWAWHPLYTESELGKAEIRKIYAETDEINIRSQVYSPVTAQGRYLTPQTSGEIVVMEGEGEKVEEVVEEEGGNVEEESIDGRTDAARLAGLDRSGGRVRYKGKLYAPNKPYRVGDRYQVLATKNGFVQLVNFAQRDIDTRSVASDPYHPRYWANLYFSFGESNAQSPMPNAQSPTPNTQYPITDDSTPSKRIIEWQGFKIGLQYLPFELRHGKMLTSAYGHFQKTKGADGMAVDVYCGTKVRSPKIFVIEQYVNGEFDDSGAVASHRTSEKYVIGVNSIEEARAIYLEVMPEEMLGSIRESSIEELRSLRTDADTIVIAGDILPEDEFEAIAIIDDEDVREAIANWKQVAPSTYSNILSAD